MNEEFERMKISEVIGNRIRIARKKKHLNQDEVSAAIGLSRTSLVNIEKGKHNTTLPSLYKLAWVLDVDVWSFLPSKADFPEYKRIVGVSTKRMRAIETIKRKIDRLQIKMEEIQ